MPAPSPDLIVDDPPPLNPRREWPYRIDPFPADALLTGLFGGPLKAEEPKDLPPNPHRKEAR